VLQDTNQPPPFEGRNLYLTHRALQEAVSREGAAWAQQQLVVCGATLGRAETFAPGRANRYGLN
jgi:putative acyl-CoA dehydrogenase